MCKGECPGTAIGGDWRNRTEHCEVWKALFARLEAELVAEGYVPVSLSARREEMERAFVQAWTAGSNTYMSRLIGAARKEEPREHWRAELEHAASELYAALRGRAGLAAS